MERLCRREGEPEGYNRERSSWVNKQAAVEKKILRSRSAEKRGAEEIVIKRKRKKGIVEDLRSIL